MDAERSGLLNDLAGQSVSFESWLLTVRLLHRGPERKGVCRRGIPAVIRRNLTALSVGAMIVTAITTGDLTQSPSSGSSPPNHGVTVTTIRVGIPYLDLSALRKSGVSLDFGNFPDAYNALIADMNAHGGINGRRIVPYLVPVSPIGTAPAATACTQLTEDDKVLVAISPTQPDCYLQAHDTPTINGTFESVEALGGAPNFSLFPRSAPAERLFTTRRLRGQKGRPLCRGCDRSK